MIKALYGTHSGGARWHDRLFDILQELNFKLSKADPYVWMRPEPGGTCYEYIAVYLMTLQLLQKILKHSAMSSRKSIISSSKVLHPLSTILAAHARKTLMELELQIQEGMSIRFLNLMKGCSRRNQESPGHHLKEEIILNLIHLNSVMNIKPSSFKH